MAIINKDFLLTAINIATGCLASGLATYFCMNYGMKNIDSLECQNEYAEMLLTNTFLGAIAWSCSTAAIYKAYYGCDRQAEKSMLPIYIVGHYCTTSFSSYTLSLALLRDKMNCHNLISFSCTLSVALGLISSLVICYKASLEENLTSASK